MKLSDKSCKAAKAQKTSYKLFDGGGLFLEIMPNGSKLWRLKYRYLGKEKRLAFGVYDLQTIKWTAVKHVYKLVGQGWKKIAAQQKIAEHCGTTLDAIKKWEKEAIKERDKDKNRLKAIDEQFFGLHRSIFRGARRHFRILHS